MICNELMCDAVVCVPEWFMVGTVGFCIGVLFTLIPVFKMMKKIKQLEGTCNQTTN